MRVKFSHVIGVSCVVLALVYGRSVYAQEGSPVSNDMPELNNHSELNNLNDDKPLLSDPDATNRYQVPSNQSHVPAGAQIIAPTNTKSKTKSADAKASNKEEDALSFNFLYYIIQKFKKSDIVDD